MKARAFRRRKFTWVASGLGWGEACSRGEVGLGLVGRMVSKQGRGGDLGQVVYVGSGKEGGQYFIQRCRQEGGIVSKRNSRPNKEGIKNLSPLPTAVGGEVKPPKI